MDRNPASKNTRKDAKVRVPPFHKIPKSKEPGFELDTFMNDFKPPDTLEDLSDNYFDSYSHFGIHEEMLKDRTRTIAYRNAIVRNAFLFKDKVVLDIGCGTGILSIFAARAGAKHVYGIEMASIAKHAQNIVKNNGLSDKITIIRGKAEEVELPVEKVDIIISEWMGYFLLYESMLDSVLYARDKWLAKDGILMPDRAILWLAGLEDEQYKNSILNFWDNVYDVKMTSIKKWSGFEPLVDVVKKQQVNTSHSAILDIDLKTVTVKELDFSSKYQIRATRNDVIHGLVAWFDCYFSHGAESVRLSTTPYLKDTHWKQTIFYFEDNISVKKDDIITGCIAVKKNEKNIRDLDVKISYHVKNEKHTLDNIQCYRIC